MPARIKSNLTHLFMGAPNWGHLVYADGVVVLGANAAYDAASGKKLWEKSTRPAKLPIVCRNWLITHPLACDLRSGEPRVARHILTGEELPWNYGRAYGCGPANGCENVLFFRSGADGFFDMIADGTTNLGGIRPGCGRTLVAANGLLIHPEGYSGCCCSYNYQTCLAMAPGPDRGNTWYVFSERMDRGSIKRLAVNLGAPGDRRTGRGDPWLSFPRPILPSACPAPVTLSMENAGCYYRSRATASIQGSDSPWVYSSGLCGRGRIAIDLSLQPNLSLVELTTAPALDGQLDDPCWQNAKAIPFENSPFSLLGANVDLRLFRDAENLYFGYRRKPLANGRSAPSEVELRADDEFDIYLTDARKRGGIHLAIHRDGETRSTFGTVDRYRKEDPTWRGEWKCAIRDTGAEWASEVAVPLKTLTDSGINPKALQMNCMSKNLTAAGMQAVFLRDPCYGMEFRRCVGFRGLVARPPSPSAERALTVRLHFAETDAIQAGERVFDVSLQGQAVLKDFDIVREAGGRNVAVVKEFRGVAANDQIVIDLIPKGEAGDERTLPIISGIEIVEEG